VWSSHSSRLPSASRPQPVQPRVSRVGTPFEAGSWKPRLLRLVRRFRELRTDSRLPSVPYPIFRNLNKVRASRIELRKSPTSPRALPGGRSYALHVDHGATPNDLQLKSSLSLSTGENEDTSSTAAQVSAVAPIGVLVSPRSSRMRASTGNAVMLMAIPMKSANAWNDTPRGRARDTAEKPPARPAGRAAGCGHG